MPTTAIKNPVNGNNKTTKNVSCGLKFISATKNINIGDVIVCSSGSWRGVYWQKVSNIDWTTSLELQKLCGGSEEIFNIWSEKNKNLEKKVC